MCGTFYKCMYLASSREVGQKSRKKLVRHTVTGATHLVPMKSREGSCSLSLKLIESNRWDPLEALQVVAFNWTNRSELYFSEREREREREKAKIAHLNFKACFMKIVHENTTSPK